MAGAGNVGIVINKYFLDMNRVWTLKKGYNWLSTNCIRCVMTAPSDSKFVVFGWMVDRDKQFYCHGIDPDKNCLAIVINYRCRIYINMETLLASIKFGHLRQYVCNDLPSRSRQHASEYINRHNAS